MINGVYFRTGRMVQNENIQHLNLLKEKTATRHFNKCRRAVFSKIQYSFTKNKQINKQQNTISQLGIEWKAF